MLSHAQSHDRGVIIESHFLGMALCVFVIVSHWLLIGTATISVITAEEVNREDNSCLCSLCRDSSLWTAGFPSLWNTWKNGYRHSDHPAEYWMWGPSMTQSIRSLQSFYCLQTPHAAGNSYLVRLNGIWAVFCSTERTISGIVGKQLLSCLFSQKEGFPTKEDSLSCETVGGAWWGHTLWPTVCPVCCSHVQLPVHR